ncbi:plasma membrane localization protein [Pyricularia oryzae]
MNAIQQKCRPKHQVLVLKCYPRTTKGAVDVKPNSSELSYLLYYAASRKSKFQKVGSFLEKKTASDVWRLRIGNVQVTLQILEALIEKNPKDLPLFAPSVLKILDLVLKSNDITMVESSTPTFEAFCANHDASSLFADQAYLKQYESIVRQYASLASTRRSPGKTTPSKPVAMRWRNTGLEAIRSVASSDALASVQGTQYDILVPMILENLWTDNEEFLEILLHRAHLEEKVDTDKLLLRRRTSVATVRTAEGGNEPNPIALSGSAMDVDKLAEEDIGVLAITCLKQIFVGPNRSQIHAATVALLKFIEERVNQDENVVKKSARTGRDSGWAIKIFGLISRWAPVQERYVILMTTMDTLVRMPLSDESMRHHIVWMAMMGALLRSDVNLIGLSVMDVLLALMQHMKRLVQLPGDPSGASASDMLLPGQLDPRSPTTIAASTAAQATAAARKELLERIQQTIGDLATHVYYADQISDMISAIIQRLRPSKSNSPGNTSPQGEKIDGQVVSPEDSTVESLFSLTVAKVAALKAIKTILLVANPRTKMAGNLGLARNKVSISVWEGTQWLLRDPEGLVRKAYADAVITWLDRETVKGDLKAVDESAPNPRASIRYTRDLGKMDVSPARRAASSASTRREPKPTRLHFLNLIHVAIYDNALQYVDYETDINLLHVLLAKLVDRLGINAVRYGLPMIFRLQEDIQEVDAPIGKVRVGCLVHGYLWALTEKFDFENTLVGRAIHNEIIRRRSKHFWIEGVHVPPPLLELIGTPGMVKPQPKMPLNQIESEALLPFDDRFALIDSICTGYQESFASPPTSPAASPGRSFTSPILGSQMSGLSPHTATDDEREVPSRFRDQMYVEWTRDLVIAMVQAGSKSASLNGSKTGTTGTSRYANARLGGNTGSPMASQQNLRPYSQPAGKDTLAPQNNPLAKLRKSSLRSNATPSPASSGPIRSGVTSVDQLKMVLSGQVAPAVVRAQTSHGNGAGGLGADDSTDSLVSYDMTVSEMSFNAGSVTYTPSHPVPRPPSRSRSHSRERRAASRSGAESPGGFDQLNRSNSFGKSNGNGRTIEDGRHDRHDDDGVPPVPPLPSGVSSPPLPPSRDGKSPSPRSPSTQAPVLPPVSLESSAIRPAKTRSLKSRGRHSRSGSIPSAPAPHAMRPATSAGHGVVGGDSAFDLDALLLGIDTKDMQGTLGNVTRPVY